jgi:hypothetical protein
MNASYTDENGIVDFNNVRKYNFGGNFNVDFTDKFKGGAPIKDRFVDIKNIISEIKASIKQDS